MKNEVYFSARTQFENMGDLLINRALLLILNNDAKIMIDCQNVPNWYIDLLTTDLVNDIELIDKFFYLRLIKRAFTINSKAKLFLFLKPGGYAGIKNLKMGTARFLQGILFRLLRCFAVTIIRAPSSHENSSKSWGLIDRFRLSPVNTQLIRDSLSIKLLKNQKLDAHKIPDLAFYYLKYPTDSIFNSTKTVTRKIEYTISFRKPRAEIDTHVYQSILDFVVKKPNLINFTSQVEFDNEINSNYAKTFNSQIKIYKKDQSSIQYILDCYAESNFVISNRLHVLLVALLCGATPIAILGPNDNKIKGVFEDLGIGSSVINYDSNGMTHFTEFKKIELDRKKLFEDNCELLIKTILSTLK